MGIIYVFSNSQGFLKDDWNFKMHKIYKTLLFLSLKIKHAADV